MRIKKLELKNFRGFEELTIDFPEGESGLAVFVGVNGAGKSSVLDAMADLLNKFCLDLTREERSKDELFSEGAPHLSTNDVKYGEDEALLLISFEFKDELVKTNWKIYSDGGRFRWKGHFDDVLLKIRKKLYSTLWLSAPIIAYYSSDRFVSNQELKIIDLQDLKPINVYKNSLNKSVDFRDFFNWFRSMEDHENEQIRFTENAKFRSDELEAARKAITLFLEGFSNFRVKRQPREEFIVEKEGQLIPLTNLSHGEKMIIAMIGDIARRSSIVYTKDPLASKGVVLIDEIEQHLHPRWQRTIIPNLRRTFPNIQFIVTTHSPQVISTLKKENVFILNDFKLIKDTPHTFGRDSNSILWDIFGVEKRPPESKLEFEKLYRLMDDPHKIKETEDMLRDIEEKYGYYDEEVIRARGQFEFLNEN